MYQYKDKSSFGVCAEPRSTQEAGPLAPNQREDGPDTATEAADEVIVSAASGVFTVAGNPMCSFPILPLLCDNLRHCSACKPKCLSRQGSPKTLPHERPTTQLMLCEFAPNCTDFSTFSPTPWAGGGRRHRRPPAIQTEARS